MGMRRTQLPTTTRSVLVALVATLAIAAGCSSSGGSASDGGWLDGPPPDRSAESRTADGDATSGAMETSAADSSASSEGDFDDSVSSTPVELTAGLRAGSVDDNEDFAGYLAYRERAGSNGVESRDLDVTGRQVVEVLGNDGRPVLGEPIEVVADGEPIASLRSGTDGRAYIHPRALGIAGDATLSVRVAGVERAPTVDGPTSFLLDRAGGATAPVALDVFFVLDATGSMGDELDRLTATVDSVAARISELDGSPDVRLGMTVYRDEGDAFLTRTFDFTDDVTAFRTALGEVHAGGGGDNPEALDEALAAAVEEPSWRPAGDAVQLMFVVADAPPQVGRAVTTPYDESLQNAAARGIRIHSVGASGTNDAAEYVLRQFAQYTGGRFVFLSYGAGGAALGPGTDIASVDYEELPLEDLLVRLVAEQLADLTGTEVSLPPSTSTTTTDPRQQQDG